MSRKVFTTLVLVCLCWTGIVSADIDNEKPLLQPLRTAGEITDDFVAGRAEGHDGLQSEKDIIKYSPLGYEALFTIGNFHEIEIII